ncbi:CLUMA_CG009554, isoform A [Clunio marinus]|uniref:CLUMA_CG009554, isoform A n=1 Tax=Clunio marinus TaxID=568069 RepID=A0A1J1I982_9DIPT|nr:CLUMA_CG009554, isoform A [Clunio marinus]
MDERQREQRQRKKKIKQKNCMKNGIIKNNRNEDRSKFTRGNPMSEEVHPKQTKREEIHDLKEVDRAVL